MPIALIAHTKGSSPDGNGFTTPAIDTSGATLLVAVQVDYLGSGSLVDSKSNTWLTAIPPKGSQPYLRILYVKSPTVGTGHTFTLTATLQYPFLAVAAFSGCDTAAPLDQTSFATGSATTMSAGSITPGVANEVVVAASLASGVGAITIGSSYVVSDTGAYVGSTAFGGGLAYIVQGAAAATNPAWTCSGGLAGAQLASFKASATTTVTPNAIATAEQVFSPTVVVPTPQTIQPGTIGTAVQVYVPVFVGVPIGPLQAGTIGSGAVVYAPSMTVASRSVAPWLVPSGRAAAPSLGIHVASGAPALVPVR